MLVTLQHVREKYGGAEGYMLKACGLDASDLENIRNNLIVEDVPAEAVVQ